MTKQENEDRLARLKNIVLSMPEKPGSYQYYDENHTIIYVGKAKNLKRRVSSYFHKEVDRYKTKVLVSKIFDISYTVVNTEEDALLLENSLIKKYNPRYNVLLKDGKTYPSICVTNEYFPRIFKTRHINKKVGTFFGHTLISGACMPFWRSSRSSTNRGLAGFLSPKKALQKANISPAWSTTFTTAAHLASTSRVTRNTKKTCVRLEKF